MLLAVDSHIHKATKLSWERTGAIFNKYIERTHVVIGAIPVQAVYARMKNMYED